MVEREAAVVAEETSGASELARNAVEERGSAASAPDGGARHAGRTTRDDRPPQAGNPVADADALEDHNDNGDGQRRGDEPFHDDDDLGDVHGDGGDVHDDDVHGDDDGGDVHDDDDDDDDDNGGDDDEEEEEDQGRRRNGGDGGDGGDDECPDDPDKDAPGQCGCGHPDDDFDGDGHADCVDVCPDNPERWDGRCPCQYNKPHRGVCGCATWDDDSDHDGVPDCKDACPHDAQKTIPGVCGCGVPDVDSDMDGVLDCIDQCPRDPSKSMPLLCSSIASCVQWRTDAPSAGGCGVPDLDSDADGTPNCLDLCPLDPHKIAPGRCGCGESERSCVGFAELAASSLRSVDAASPFLAPVAIVAACVLALLCRRLQRSNYRRARLSPRSQTKRMDATPTRDSTGLPPSPNTIAGELPKLPAAFRQAWTPPPPQFSNFRLATLSSPLLRRGSSAPPVGSDSPEPVSPSSPFSPHRSPASPASQLARKSPPRKVVTREELDESVWMT